MPRLTKRAPKAAKRKRASEEMRKFSKGKLKSSSGQKVTDPAQAKAIAMSESGQSRKKRKSSKDSQGRNIATKTKPKRKAANRKVRNKGRA